MIRPDLRLALAFNEGVRAEDEWFDEPDDLERVAGALAAIDGIEDPVQAAAILAFRMTRAQAFGEGNKRTALLLARWVLDHNGRDGSALLPPDDREVGELLVRAAAGTDVEEQLMSLLRARS